MCWCQRRRTTLEEEQGHNLQMVNVINIEWVCAQSCWTLCDPTDCSPPGSSVHGISQTRTLEWVAISSSRGSSRPRNQTHISCLLHWQEGSLPPAPPGLLELFKLIVNSKLFPLPLLAFLMDTSLKVVAYALPSLLLLPPDRTWCLLMWSCMAYHAVAPFLENCK